VTAIIARFYGPTGHLETEFMLPQYEREFLFPLPPRRGDMLKRPDLESAVLQVRKVRYVNVGPDRHDVLPHMANYTFKFIYDGES
jgi:hypothetical protein